MATLGKIIEDLFVNNFNKSKENKISFALNNIFKALEILGKNGELPLVYLKDYCINFSREDYDYLIEELKKQDIIVIKNEYSGRRGKHICYVATIQNITYNANSLRNGYIYKGDKIIPFYKGEN